MSSRLQTRLIAILVLVFLFIGFFTIDQRPKDLGQRSSFLNLIHGFFEALPKLAKNEPPKSPDQLDFDKNLELLDASEDPCTVMHPTHGFIDLRPLSTHNGGPHPWSASGLDSDQNYTLGICLVPFAKDAGQLVFKDVEDPSKVGAFFMDPITKEYVLMGQVSDKPKFVGRKLMLTYEDGSFCDSIVSSKGERLRRRTIVTFKCDHDMLHKASVSHVASVHGCTYMFEVRSHFVCPTAAKADNLAAIWIFLFILFAAGLVFFSGSYVMNFFRKNTSYRK
ncbi:hypothetical protein PUMCH_003143 [Australozyma saopauloensis]|uniref:MRH domain-containing protein n=1 Tax=Australozyma saopauloensis TaxID=291208 RepID=A0AAX4HD73_9ASCO|nr:hypothetical protein PUMCH_003143 [[Candida] saopauloensis]